MYKKYKNVKNMYTEELKRLKNKPRREIYIMKINKNEANARIGNNKRNYINRTNCNHYYFNYLSNNQYICSVRRKWNNCKSTKSKRRT